jgi:NADH:ubiquinone oxidoreductase subunit 4 (subunit M)
VAGFSDLGSNEKWTIIPITLLMFAIGVAPQTLFNIFNTTVVQMARLLA